MPASALLLLFGLNPLSACAGITLKAKDGAVVFGRTMEWGSFDLKLRLVIVARGHATHSTLADGKKGLSWTTKFGAVGLDAVEKDFIVDGMNEVVLVVDVFYHPGFAEYPKSDLGDAGQSLGCLDLCGYLLTTCATVEELRQALSKIAVVGVVVTAIGIVPPDQLIVTDPSGKSIVIEFTKGVTSLHDAPLGVITNAPNVDWHITNFRNYIKLSPVALPDKKIEELNFAPLGGGSGMIGLPGDFTPPSRFVSATVFAKSARPTPDCPETMYELFRILDNFNIPLGAADGEGAASSRGVRSSTLWTTGYDTKNRVMQDHTMNNRRIRQLDLKKIGFANPKVLTHIPLDKQKEEDIEEVTVNRR